jgi:hypothetical protein
VKYLHLSSRPTRHALTTLRRLGITRRPATQGEAMELIEQAEVGRAGRYETVAEEMERRSRQ